jgi:hypothetical protein
MTSWIRSRLRVTERSRDWRKLSTLLSSPVVAVELRREREGAERPEVLRREEALEREAPERDAVRLAEVLRLAVVFAREALALVVFLAVADFERLLLALEPFALVLFAPVRLAPVLLRAPVFFVAISPPRQCRVGLGGLFHPGTW